MKTAKINLKDEITKDICAWLHWYDTKFIPENHEHAMQEKEKSYQRYENDAYFHISVDSLTHAIMNTLDRMRVFYS